jgi:5S rRNA maturation endonuclease (ribonuclease M5)
MESSFDIEKFRDSTVIVEGKKDKRALEALEFRDVRALNSSLFSFVESLNVNKVCILTDLDKEGRKLYSKLKSLCSRNGIRVDDRLRSELFKTKVRQIEGLKLFES